MSDFVEQEELGPGAEPARVAREMQDRETMLWGKVGLKLFAGIPLTVVGPFVVAVVLWVAVGFDWFSLWFVLALAAWAYVAHRMVKARAGGDLFTDAIVEKVGVAGTSGRKEEPNPIVEIALKGPMDVYEAWQLMQERKAFGPMQRKRAEEVVVELSKRERAIPWLQLKREEENLQEFMRVVGYLRLTDWVELDSEGRKMWLLSDAKKAVMGRKG